MKTAPVHDPQNLPDLFFKKHLCSELADRIHSLSCPLLQALAEKSPTPLPSIPQEAEFYQVKSYYDDLICIGADRDSMETTSRLELTAPVRTYTLVVPAPMTARNGWSREKRGFSSCTTDNTGRAHAAVFSAHHLDLSKQLEAIAALRNHGKLAFVVMVSENHVEAWFPTTAMRISLSEFREIAAELGAGEKIKISCTPYHVPGGINAATGMPQSVIYLDRPVLKAMQADAELTPEARKQLQQSDKRKNRKKGKKRRRCAKSLTKSQMS